MQCTIVNKQPVSDAIKIKTSTSAMAEELIALCPGCKTMETVYFSNGQLISTRKFSQDDGHIFHDCSSNQPCRLYRTI